MDSIVVTGGRGRSGRWLVDRLAEEYRVACVDLDHPGYETAGRRNVTFRAGDLTDAGEAFDLLTDLDPDAVVHWAAIPSNNREADTRIFGTNTDAAFNVLSAAGRLDAPVVQASSEAVYGFFFAEETPLPDRLPVTEGHPRRPEDAYGTAKLTAEEVGKMVARRHGVPVASIRPSWIQYPGEYNCRRSVDDLRIGAGDYWSYVDVRDVAGIVAAALAAALDGAFAGHEAFNAHAADNCLGRPTLAAMEEQFGSVPDEAAIDGEASAFSTAKAERVLDWEPDHEWRDAAEEDASAPSLTLE